MKLKELFESVKKTRLVVVYGGRFQPFHKGHYEAYRWLVKKFGEENVWIATSNKTNFNQGSDISPFTFNEKKEIMVSLYGIDPRRIVKCKNPAFNPVEIFEQYKGFSIVYVSAVGKKDEDRYIDNMFFKRYPNESMKIDELFTLDDKHGYFIEVPMKEDKISGTQVRDGLSSADEEDRVKLFKKYFGKYDSMIDDLITAKLKELK
jgi:cytidyltransferase-like protein